MADKKSVNLLPEYIRSDKNSKFLSSTIDQFIQTPKLERIDGYVGSLLTPNFNPSTDFYLKQESALRKNYALEPALVFKDSSANITDVVAYDDLINELTIQGSPTQNLDRLFRSKFYSYDPLIDWDKLVNYSNYYWLPTGPEEIIIDGTGIDVVDDILGKTDYEMPNGYSLTNGLLISFSDTVLPASYRNKQFVVEGVGESIKLIDFSLLEANESLARVYNETFDSDKFDEYPFDGDTRFPLDPAYITINKSSRDLNPWTRYNRWFHSEVIRISAEINGNVPVYPLSQKAKRPIIEFKPNIQLYNFGKRGIRNVDVIDNNTLDAFSYVDGTYGYYSDGVLLSEGQRVIFNADINDSVRGKIYQVRYDVSGSSPVLRLIEADDFAPADLDSISVNSGDTARGTSWYFNSSLQTWTLSQQYTKINQAPLFDLFDNTGVSYSLGAGISDFVGNQIFGYDVGSGQPDQYLGFPLKYQNSVGVGSYLFKNYFMVDSITVTVDNQSSTIPTGIALLKINHADDTEELVNVWKPAEQYQIPIIENQIVEEATQTITVQSLNKPFDTNLVVISYVNGVKTDATVELLDNVVLTFDNALSKNDLVSLRILTSQTPNDNGYYEAPLGLTNNPLNDFISNMTLSELSDHLGTMLDRYSQETSVSLTSQNLRDVVDYTKYGTRLIVNANPISFAKMFLAKKEHNVVDALRLAADQYSQFKMNLLRFVSQISDEVSAADALDAILAHMNISRDSKSPYYNSDMLGYGQDKVVVEYTVSPSVPVEYPVGIDFKLDVLSFTSVIVYLNGEQLVVGADYRFNSVGDAVVILTALQAGDKISIVRYSNTQGCFVPATPTKLGLYPKFAPKIYVDDTYIDGPVEVIQCHDGSVIKSYGDYRDAIILEFEKRIYNNIKIAYAPELIDIKAVLPGAFRDTGFTTSEVNAIIQKDFIKWAGVYGVDAYTNDTYDEGNSFTWNYKGCADNLLGLRVSGYWRAVFEYFFDTDRPHTHPWEMLGLSTEPEWWVAEYGPAPYTSTNLTLWEDLEAGYVRGEDVILPHYARPGLQDIIPVDSAGNLLSPADFLTTEPTYANKKAQWKFGDRSPAETAWRRSSYWPFVVNILAALTQPSTYTSVAYDLSRTQINSLGQVTYFEDDLYLNPKKLIIDSGDTQIAGYGVYVIEKGRQIDVDYISTLQQDFTYIDFNLFHKLGGFASKEKLQVSIDSIDPVSASPGAVLPPEDYSLILNVSNPIKAASISGIIVQKFNGNFIVKGYDKSNPYFEIFKPIKTANSGAVTVGGVSAPFSEWTSAANNNASGLSAIETVSVETTTTRYYKQGQIVRYNNRFYRVKVSHNAQSTFDPELFQQLPSLPVTGGATAQLPTRFESSVTQVPYGTEFSTVQEVYDLIVGYGAYLENAGFVFDYYNTDLNEVLNWSFTGKEFLFWTTQNWADNNLITLSPFAHQIKYSFNNSVVDNISTGKYEYSLLKADGKSFPIDRFKLLREDGICTVETVDTEEGFFFATLHSVQKEHGMVFNNSTIFNDTIYDIETGYRQARVKFSGFRTSDWNGDLSSPGFVYDDVETSDWGAYQTYLPGKVVRYNGSYYSAIRKIVGDASFDFAKWVKLPEKPQQDLLPNFDYKINQFEDFYSLDIDNFDAGQQQLAQHLVGYTPRSYLNNIFTNQISQYKFYQGYIKEKGTRNAIDKIAKVGTFARKGTIDFKEEWAFRAGHYGAYETYNELEFSLEEGSFLENPYVVKFVSETPAVSNELVNYVKSADLHLSPVDYNPLLTFETLPSDFIENNLELTTAGYVRPDDVTVTAYNKNSLLDIANNTLLKNGDTIWLGFLENGDWTVYRYAKEEAKITGVFVSAPASEITFVTNVHHGLSEGDVISVVRFNSQVNGVYIVKSIPELNQFTVESTLSTIVDDDLLSYGTLFKFAQARYANFYQLSLDDSLIHLTDGSKVWIDQGDNSKWSVYEKIHNYDDGTVYKLTDIPLGKHLGYTVHTTEDSSIVLAAAPGWNKPAAPSLGRVAVYDKLDGSLEKQFEFSINDATHRYCDPTSSTQFGYALAHDVQKGFIFASAPEASRVAKETSTLTNVVVISTGTGTIQTFESEGLVKVSVENANFSEAVTVAVLAHPNAISSSSANYARFGHSIYVNDVASTASTLLLVGAPGSDQYAGGSGNVFAYYINESGAIAAHPSGISVASHIPLSNKSKWGYKIAGSKSGDIISISAPDHVNGNTKGVIQIYNSNLEWQQTIFSPFATTDRFGYDVEVSASGKYLLVSSVDVRLARQSFGKVAVYVNTDTGFVLNQVIDNPTKGNDLRFGYSISISEDEQTLLISALGKNRSRLVKFDVGSRTSETVFDGGTTRFVAPVPDAGTVYLYNNLGGYFVQADEIQDPNHYEGSRYGASVVATNNSLVIGSPSYSSSGLLSINTTTVVTVPSYENVYVEFSQPDLPSGYKPIVEVLVSDNSIYKTVIGLKIISKGKGYLQKIDADLVDSCGNILDTLVVVTQPDNSSICYFEKLDETKGSWDRVRYQSDVVDVSTIKRVVLIDSLKEEITEYLDIVDPLKGRIAGIAEQELKFKSAFDPAIYSIGTAGAVVDTDASWIDEHVGQLWWDLSTAKYIWYEQGDETFRKSYWGELFPGASIDVYEWVKSDLLPSEWAAQADTNEGLTKGVSGQPKYPDNSNISVKQVYNNVTGAFENVYYFWVKNKVLVPDVINRRISSYQVASLIADPASNGLKFAEILSPDAVAFANVQPSLVGKRIHANIVIDTNTENIPRHTEWTLIEEGSVQGEPTELLNKKLFDSLLGHDLEGRLVPDQSLTSRNRYGIGIRPQQTLFKDRLSALRNVVDFANSVLVKERIVGNYRFDNLNKQEEIPDIFSRKYDFIVEDLSSLSNLETTDFVRAEIECYPPVNGRIVSVRVTNPGFGYVNPPLVKVHSNRENTVEITTEIDSLGRVVNAYVTNKGEDIVETPVLSVRAHTAIVQVNEDYSNKWTEHAYDYTSKQWIRTRTQAYNTPLYWKYVDWKASDFDTYRDYKYVISSVYELATLEDVNAGDYVKVSNSGNGKYMILERTPANRMGNFSVYYDIVYIQEGTIRILDSIWNYNNSNYSYDDATFEETLYDQIPDLEVFYLLTALKEDIFVNDLKINWNNLFFSAVKYALTEQKLLDWAFKTSFINVTNTLGELDQRPVYKLDNESFFEDYIKEVKPYHTKIRNYVSRYTASQEVSDLFVTDFDLPSYYNTVTEKFETVNLGDPLLSQRPWSDWANNYKYNIEEISVGKPGSGYTQRPTVVITTATGDTGSGAAAEAYIRGGKLHKIVVTNPGSGYVIPPIVQIVGGGSVITTATAYPIFGGSPVRKNTVGMRFDRVNSSAELADTQVTETFVCPGDYDTFDLSWMADTDKMTITPLLDGKLVYATDYIIEHFPAEGAGYNRQRSRFKFLNSIPASGQVLKITYKKNINLYTAVDRINHLYAPTDEMPGSYLPLLMYGTEYPRTNVQGLPFEYSSPMGGSEGSRWYNQGWEDQSDYYTVSRLASTATVGDTSLVLTSVDGIVPGQLINILNSSTIRIREGTQVVSVNTSTKTIGITTPSYRIKRMRANGLSTTATIVVKTEPEFTGNIKQGDIAIVTNIDRPGVTGFNGTYVVSKIVDNSSFEVTATNVLSTTTVGIYTSSSTVRVSSVLGNIDTRDVIVRQVTNFIFSTGTYAIDTGVPFVDAERIEARLDGIVREYGVPIVGPFPASEYYHITQGPDGQAIVTWYQTTGYHDSDIRVYAGPQIEFWKLDHDAAGLDSAIEGGTWNEEGALEGALGVNPEDIIIDGDGFISPNASFAPEEYLPGHTVDSVGINVYTKADRSYAIAITNTFPIEPSSVPTIHEIGMLVDEVAGMLVHFNGQIFNRKEDTNLTNSNEYYVDGSNLIVAPQSVPGRLCYTIMTLGGDSELDTNVVTIKDQEQALVTSLIYNVDARSAYVLMDGRELPEIVGDPESFGSTGYVLTNVSSLDQRACVKVYNIQPGEHTIEAWFFKTPYAVFNRVHTQVITVTDTPTSNFEIQLPPGSAEPASAQAIVEVDTPEAPVFRKRLSPPWVSYYKVDDDQRIFDIDNKNTRPAGTYSLNNVKVYANGYELRPGFDFLVNETTGQIILTEGKLDNGDALAVMGLVDYDYVIVGNTVFLTVPLVNQSLKVTTFTEHNDMFMRTERFDGTATRRYTLSRPSLNDNFVWVYVNGNPLSARYDYEIMEDTRTIQLSEWIDTKPGDVVLITTIDPPAYGEQILGYRIFTDIFGRTHYKRLAEFYSTTLAKELVYTDNEIHVTDASRIIPPNPAQNKPGVVLIDGERIEFLAKEGNVLKQLRRSTLGTGPAFLSEAGTKVIDQSPQQSIPYLDSIYSQSTITTTSTVYTIDTSTIVFNALLEGIDQVSVYYGGRQLRKSELVVHDLAIAFDTTASSVSVLAPEFTIDTTSNEITLNISNGVTSGTNLTIVQKRGYVWTGTESLLTSPVQQAVFLRAKEAELPDIYYYGGDPTLLDEGYFPLTDDNDQPLQGY